MGFSFEKFIEEAGVRNTVGEAISGQPPSAATSAVSHQVQLVVQLSSAVFARRLSGL